VRALVLVGCAGCSQLLGLQDTKFDFKDAMIDAPSVCDGAPACSSTTGRSACGYLVDTGANSGIALHVASPTGGACSGSSEGPCALSVYGQSEADFFAGAATQVQGTIDDCGRFVVPDLPTSAANVAIVFSGADNVTTALLVLDRPAMPGTDTGLVAYPVSTATEAAWSTQLSTTVGGGYLVLFARGTVPQATEVAWVGGGPIMGPPRPPPWAAYFGGDTPFGMLDPSATQSEDSGTALVVAPAGSFMLGGAKFGATCKQIAVQTVGAALVQVSLSC
jgi:hypothetical protein